MSHNWRKDGGWEGSKILSYFETLSAVSHLSARTMLAWMICKYANYSFWTWNVDVSCICRDMPRDMPLCVQESTLLPCTLTIIRWHPRCAKIFWPTKKQNSVSCWIDRWQIRHTNAMIRNGEGRSFLVHLALHQIELNQIDFFPKQVRNNICKNTGWSRKASALARIQQTTNNQHHLHVRQKSCNEQHQGLHPKHQVINGKKWSSAGWRAENANNADLEFQWHQGSFSRSARRLTQKSSSQLCSCTHVVH